MFGNSASVFKYAIHTLCVYIVPYAVCVHREIMYPPLFVFILKLQWTNVLCNQAIEEEFYTEHTLVSLYRHVLPKATFEQQYTKQFPF